METVPIKGTSFNFSAVRPEQLDETEYTLVSLVVDRTGSISGFTNELLQCIKTVVEACKKNPRSENLLLRITQFEGTNVNEVHGFKPLSTIDSNDYKKIVPGGMTNLYDAVVEALSAAEQYATTLAGNDFDVNTATYILTDGMDNQSISSKKDVKNTVERIKKNERCGQMTSVLIGVNATDCSNYLQSFQTESGLDTYVNVTDATPGKLAKLAGFISKSISSSSQALAGGSVTAPVASLTI